MSHVVYTDGTDQLLPNTSNLTIKSLIVSNSSTDAQNLLVHNSATNDNAVMRVDVTANDTVPVPVGVEFRSPGVYLEHSNAALKVTVVVA